MSRRVLHALFGNLILAALIVITVGLVGPWASLWATVEEPWPAPPEHADSWLHKPVGGDVTP